MKARVAFFVILLAASSLPAYAPSAAAQSSAPWWDPPEVKGPADYEHGWNFRVPLRLTNAESYPITETHPVVAHLEMNRLAAEAGWLSTTAAGQQVARSFTFDPDSVRLIEYKQNWAGIQSEIPVWVDHQWLEADQSERFGKVQNQDFDPRTNPVVTLTWLPTSPIPAGGAAYYYAYFEATENSEKEPAEISRLDQERFDATAWVGRATDVWGHAQGSLAANVEVQALHPDTTITVYEYRRGFPRPTLRDIQPLANPFVIPNAGDRQAFAVSPSDTAFKIEADKPVLVSNFQGPRRTSEFVPSLDRGLLGTDFRFPVYFTGAFYYLGRAPPSQAAINVQITETDAGGNANTRTAQIGATQGYVQDTLTAGTVVRIQSDAPIAIQPRPFDEQPGLHQAPSMDAGSPYGTNFYASATHAGGFGLWQLAGMDTVANPSVYALPPGTRIYPNAGGPLIPFMPGVLPLQLPVPGFPGNDPVFTLPHYVWSTDLDSVPEDQRGPISVRVGWGGQDIAPIGGHDARHFLYRGPVAVFAHHGGTVVTHVGGGEETTFFLLADGQRQIDAPANRWQELHSNKPLTVVPILDHADGDEGHLRWLAGRLAPPPVEILKPEFRGYLVQVASPDGADPIFKTAKPGESVTIPVDITNRGRWIGGVPLTDTVHVTATPQAGWDGTAHWVGTGTSSSSVALGSGESRTMELVLKPPKTATGGTAVSVAITASSEGNPSLVDRIQALLLVEQGFGVKMWWDAGGSTSVTDIVRTLDAGATRSFNAFLENTGSGTDSYNVATAGGSLGWSVRVETPTQPGQRLERVADVVPGEIRPIRVVVTAPSSQEQEAQTLFLMQVFSESSASTSALLQAVFQLNLRREVNLEADVPRLNVLPGRSAEFPLRLVNSGENAATISIEILEALPTGWTARLDGFVDQGQTAEVTLLPEQEFEFLVNVTASPDARFADFVPALVQARLADGQGTGESAVSLLSVVGRTFELGATTQTSRAAAPGDTVRIDVNVTHAGNSPANVTMVATDLPAGWTANGQTPTLLPTPADANDTVAGMLTLNVTIPPQALAGTYPVKLQVVQLEGGVREIDIKIHVAERLDAAIEGPAGPVAIGPNETVVLPVVVRNAGNAPLGIQAAAMAPAGWATTVTPGASEVAPGTNRTFMVAVTAPHRDETGAHPVSVGITDVRRGVTEPVRWDMMYALPDVEILSVNVGSSVAQIRGDVLFLTAVVANRGGAAASSVPLDLVVDGERVDGVSLGTVAPNGTVFATLQMSWPGHFPTIEVVANAAEFVAETDYTNNRYVLEDGTVQYEPSPVTPWPGPAVLIAVLAALGMHFRRRDL